MRCVASLAVWLPRLVLGWLLAADRWPQRGKVGDGVIRDSVFRGRTVVLSYWVGGCTNTSQSWTDAAG